MSKKLNLFAWFKWVFRIIKIKYWFNISLLTIGSIFVSNSYTNFTSNDPGCGPCAGIWWAISAIFITLFNIFVFGAITPDNCDEICEEIAGYIKHKYNKASKHFSGWWNNRP